MVNKSILAAMAAHLKKNPKESDIQIFIPSLWAGKTKGKKPAPVNVNRYFSNVITGILSIADSKTDYLQPYSRIYGAPRKDRLNGAVIYNLFPRVASSFNLDGREGLGSNKGSEDAHQKDITLNEQGVRETGTFFKTLALLPHIRKMGVDTLYLLPVNEVGKDARRGDLGSIYAVKNVYRFDESLVDPLVPFSGEEQFAAVVEAAHMLGMRVIMEFPLRTTSRDADWVGEHPDWYYWIDKKEAPNFAPPEFTDQELESIREIPEGFGKYIAPAESYRSLFRPVPAKAAVKKEADTYVADTRNTEAVVASAFADWPPNDSQPAWKDVSYLRMYNHAIDPAGGANDYNYVAYNTIRYYDPMLAITKNENESLWKELSQVIPFYQKKYGIDGSMVDMGHAIPSKLVKNIIDAARSTDEGFIFLEENFYPQTSSKKTGYDASVGFEWSLREDEMKNFIDYTASNPPIPVFGTIETHNTPRSAARGGEPLSRSTFLLNAFLPNVVPFIHSGFELLEIDPVNTGLGFTPEQIFFYSNRHLGLFDMAAYSWTRERNIVDFITKVLSIRSKYIALVNEESSQSIRVLSPQSPFGRTVAFERVNHKKKKRLLVICNTETKHNSKFYLKVEGTGCEAYADLLTGFKHTFCDDWLSYDLEPGEGFVLEIPYK